MNPDNTEQPINKEPRFAMDYESTKRRSELSEVRLTKGIKFLNSEEKAVAMLLGKYLNLKAIDGITYQRPIDGKSRLDFYLPEQNIALEWHPIVLKWYMHEKNYKQFRHVLKGLPADKQDALRTIMQGELMHAYERKRRFLMDRSYDDDVKTARLIICEDVKDLYEKILKPYSKKEFDISNALNDFKNFKRKK